MVKRKRHKDKQCNGQMNGQRHKDKQCNGQKKKIKRQTMQWSK